MTMTKGLRQDLSEQGIHAPLDTSIIEIGHYFTKYTPVKLGFVVKHFRSLCMPISEYDYNRAIDTGAGASVIKDGLSYFMIGEGVNALSLVSTPTGQERYTNKFYGPLFAYTLAQMYPQGIPSAINVYVTYPWADYPFVSMLKQLLTGKIEFEYNGKVYKTEVITVVAQPESIGGLAYSGLNHEGALLKDSIFSKKTHKNGILIDIGGNTLQLAGIDADGRINRGMGQESHYGLGGQGILDQLQTQIRSSSQHRDFFKHVVGAFPIETLNDILLSDKWVYEERGYELDCASVVKAAGAVVMNGMYAHLKRFSNLRFSHIFIGGGGGNATFSLLKEMLDGAKVMKDVNANVNMLTHPKDMIIANCGGHAKTVLSLWTQKGTKRDALVP